MYRLNNIFISGMFPSRANASTPTYKKLTIMAKIARFMAVVMTVTCLVWKFGRERTPQERRQEKTNFSDNQGCTQIDQSFQLPGQKFPRDNYLFVSHLSPS